MGPRASRMPIASGTGMRARQDYEYAWLMAGVGPDYDGKWWDSAAWSESQITLRPGVGYWYQRRGNQPFNWSNPGPQP